MRLRLGTFNVWGLPEPFARHVEQRIRKLAARLADLDLDVLLVQEAWTTRVREILFDAAPKSGFRVSAHSPGASSGGLLVLSRLPIRDARFERYLFRGDPERVLDGEYFGAKGFLVTTLEGSDGPVFLVNTHLLAHYRRGHPQLDSAVRTVQLLQLIGALRKLEHPVVIGGDFNCCHSDPEYSVFVGLTGAVEAAELRPELATISRSNYYKRRRSSADERIDFLFVRAGPDARWSTGRSSLLFHDPVHVAGRDRSLSDHFGLASELELATSVPNAAASGALDREALEVAAGLLEMGRAEMLRRQQDQWLDAGTWLASAALAVCCRPLLEVDRRAFLRSAVQALGLLALAPATGYTSLAGLDAPHKLEAFEHARSVLAELQHYASLEAISA